MDDLFLPCGPTPLHSGNAQSSVTESLGAPVQQKRTPTYYYIITKSPLNHPSHRNLLTSNGILHGIVQIMKLENLLTPCMITAAGYRPALG